MKTIDENMDEYEKLLNETRDEVGSHLKSVEKQMDDKTDPPKIEYNWQRMQEIENISSILRDMIREGLEAKDIPEKMEFKAAFQSYTLEECAIVTLFQMVRVPKTELVGSSLKISPAGIKEPPKLIIVPTSKKKKGDDE